MRSPGRSERRQRLVVLILARQQAVGQEQRRPALRGGEQRQRQAGEHRTGDAERRRDLDTGGQHRRAHQKRQRQRLCQQTIDRLAGLLRTLQIAAGQAATAELGADLEQQLGVHRRLSGQPGRLQAGSYRLEALEGGAQFARRRPVLGRDRRQEPKQIGRGRRRAAEAQRLAAAFETGHVVRERRRLQTGAQQRPAIDRALEGQQAVGQDHAAPRRHRGCRPLIRPRHGRETVPLERARQVANAHASPHCETGLF